MANNALERYIELKRQIADLERQLEALKEQVFEGVNAKGGEIEADDFVIRSYKNPRYKFSVVYESKNAELKELRKREIEDGVAVVDGYTEYVKLNFKKPKPAKDPQE